MCANILFDMRGYFEISEFEISGVEYLNFHHDTPCMKYIYSRLSLYRLRLSRITAYLEEKNLIPVLNRNLTSGNKILWIRGEIHFPQYFQHIFLTKGVKLHVHL